MSLDGIISASNAASNRLKELSANAWNISPHRFSTSSTSTLSTTSSSSGMDRQPNRSSRFSLLSETERASARSVRSEPASRKSRQELHSEKVASMTALPRTLTKVVLHFDQLSGSFVTLRQQLKTILEGVEEHERQYERCMEEIQQLRFERKFLKEVVELTSGSNLAINTGNRKRWSSPVDNDDDGGAWRMDSRRWTVGGLSQPDSAKGSPIVGMSHDDLAPPFLPYMDEEARVTVDDLASRRFQRAAFASMLQVVRDTFLTRSGLPSTFLSPTHFDDDSFPLDTDEDISEYSSHSKISNHSGSTTILPPFLATAPMTPKEKHIYTLQAKISHLNSLIAELSPVVEALRESIEDIIAGPALAYRAWIREAEIERELLRVECEGLREARANVSNSARVSLTVSSVHLDDIWLDEQFNNESKDDEWETESVYWSCDEDDDHSDKTFRRNNNIA
ncbi:hypothetical protein BC832DRAFT_180425 [Gaertneriomyces semiglobifer]|nr:hypothetical protein BC832DRAFT_180425 [Gaertneriomyces semiglobifer]